MVTPSPDREVEQGRPLLKSERGDRITFCVPAAPVRRGDVQPQRPCRQLLLHLTNVVDGAVQTGVDH